MSLDVTSAYYDAVLADQFVAIADSSLAQTEALLAQTKVARQVGNASEYDLLRAQVTRDNQMPVAHSGARRIARSAYLRLKQLLNMPLDDSLALTTRHRGREWSDAAARSRPNVRATRRQRSRAGSRARRSGPRAGSAGEDRAGRAHSVALARLELPASVFPERQHSRRLEQGVNNWTVGSATSFPMLDGGRIKGDQTRRAGGRRSRRARSASRRASSPRSTRASRSPRCRKPKRRGTRVAARPSRRSARTRSTRCAIAKGSRRRPISRSRACLLEQAKANRAQAARNLAVARVRLALLRDLPIGTTGASVQSGAQAARTNSSRSNATAQQQQQQRTNSNTAAGSGGTTGSTQP